MKSSAAPSRTVGALGICISTAPCGSPAGSMGYGVMVTGSTCADIQPIALAVALVTYVSKALGHRQRHHRGRHRVAEHQLVADDHVRRPRRRRRRDASQLRELSTYRPASTCIYRSRRGILAISSLWPPFPRLKWDWKSCLHRLRMLRMLRMLCLLHLSYLGLCCLSLHPRVCLLRLLRLRVHLFTACCLCLLLAQPRNLPGDTSIVPHGPLEVNSTLR